MNSKLLKQLREASGLTLAEVATKADFTVQTVWSAMRGEVSDETAERIRKVLVKAVEARRAQADELLSQVNVPATETPTAA
jgi:transcriptional regulator with XRE-family HTH domain